MSLLPGCEKDFSVRKRAQFVQNNANRKLTRSQSSHTVRCIATKLRWWKRVCFRCGTYTTVDTLTWQIAHKIHSYHLKISNKHMCDVLDSAKASRNLYVCTVVHRALYESMDSTSAIIHIVFWTVKRTHKTYSTHAHTHNGNNNDPTQNCMAMNFYMCRSCSST